MKGKHIGLLRQIKAGKVRSRPHASPPLCGAAEWCKDERPRVNWAALDRSWVKAKAASEYGGQLTDMCSSLTY